jgi:hypothetical protein
MLWLTTLALAADPAALRQLHGTVAVADVSTEAVGVAADLGPVLVAVEHAYGSYVAAHAGKTTPLTAEDRPWGIDGIGAVGLAGLVATPGVALIATGELRGGFRDERGQATLGLVVPVALRVDVPPQLAVPVGLELRLAAKLGPLWVGARGQAGGTLVVGGVPAGHANLGGFIGVAK